MNVPCFQAPWVSQSQTRSPLSRWHFAIILWGKESDWMSLFTKGSLLHQSSHCLTNTYTGIKACRMCRFISQLELVVYCLDHLFYSICDRVFSFPFPFWEVRNKLKTLQYLLSADLVSLWLSAFLLSLSQLPMLFLFLCSDSSFSCLARLLSFWCQNSGCL
jgi:hypothetical protein